jgi:hypothetical protein
MADGYLESHQEEYEKRKAAWLKKKGHAASCNISRPEDESL